jgi:hypothetical protein
MRSSAWPVCLGFGSPTGFIISSPSSPIYIPTRWSLDWTIYFRQYLHGVVGRQGIKALGQGVEGRFANAGGFETAKSASL